MQLVHGQIPSKIFTQTPVSIWHGGAAPSDPQGEAAQKAQHVIAELMRAWKERRFSSELPPFLMELTPERKLAIQAIRLLENHPDFNAGYGAALQSDGVPRLSASMMDSVDQVFSAVMNVQGIRHPSLLAAYLQRQKHSILDAQGSRDLAATLELKAENLVTDERRAKWLEMQTNKTTGTTGTVGCLVYGLEKTLMTVTSTGGVGNETVGRLGDTPTIAGNYSSKFAAASFTGVGEKIISLGGAAKLCLLAEQFQDLQKASEVLLEEAQTQKAILGFVALMKRADHIQYVAARTAPSMIWALFDGEKVRSGS